MSPHRGRLEKISEQQSTMVMVEAGGAEDEQSPLGEAGDPPPADDYNCWGFIVQHEHAVKFLKVKS
eukprot:5960565-Pyramimonas_sp.AAC.1